MFLALLTFIVMLIGGIAYLTFLSKRRFVPTDTVTLCPLNRSPSELVVILLDVSDAFSQQQRLQIENLLRRVRSGAPQFALLEVYSVDRADGAVGAPVIHICNPGTGDDLNRLYQNPRLARSRWSAFAARLDSTIGELAAASSAQASPIFEAMQSVALRTFGQPRYDGRPKTLVVVSDLIQHLPGRLSMYDGLPGFDDFVKSDYFSEVRADLRDVDVVIFYLARSHTTVQGGAHIIFWEQYFREEGARVTRVEKVFGDR